MRIPDDSLPAVQAIKRALHEAYILGQHSTSTERFAGGAACQDLLLSLGRAGFEIVRKGNARPGEPIEIKLPDGSIHGYYRDGEVVPVRFVAGDEPDEAPKPGADIVLTPEGERIIKAVAAGDYSDISERDVAAIVFGTPAMYALRRLAKEKQRAVELGLTPEDFTGKLEPGKADEDHKGHTRGLDTAPPSPWILKEVVPGDVKIEPDVDPGSRFEHEISASATAVLAKGSDRREITTRTSWNCMEDALESAVHNALSSAIRQAREAAAAFISATSPAPVTAPEEAA